MNKIDFALIVSVEMCNPNGDPLNNHTPRQDIDGYGFITDVCLKRKIRNRFSDFGEKILILDGEHSDGLLSIDARIKSEDSLKKYAKDKTPDGFKREACRIWIDVRTFGQVFAYKNLYSGCSIPIRGPVSIGLAKSLAPIDIIHYGCTKSANYSDNGGKKDSTTFNTKSIVSHGAYVAYGSIFPQLAELTGFSDADAELLKRALATIFENDASAARPSGSMGSQLYWWEHNCPTGCRNSLHVHKSLNIMPENAFPYYVCNPEDIPGIKLSVL